MSRRGTARGNLHIYGDPRFWFTLCQMNCAEQGGNGTAGGNLACTRPYDLGKRKESTSRTRERVLRAAREQLEKGGVRDLTMGYLAEASGVTRQTIHNLFGTRSGVLEALFDWIAQDAGMQRMREVMTQTDPETMVVGFVGVFATFWAKDRLLLRRIHGLAAIDPELGEAVKARNQRRQMAATRLAERVGGPVFSSEERARLVATLAALTSFEFFDALAEGAGSSERAVAMLYPLVKRALNV